MMVMGDFLGDSEKGHRLFGIFSAWAMALLPSLAWVFMISHSSGVSLPGLSRM
jgi:hypothetical protein